MSRMLTDTTYNGESLISRYLATNYDFQNVFTRKNQLYDSNHIVMRVYQFTNIDNNVSFLQKRSNRNNESKKKKKIVLNFLNN